MNTKPILFSGAMVRAILDGTKTQTRRIIKNPINALHTGGHPVKLLADWALSGLVEFDPSSGVVAFDVQCAVDDTRIARTACPYGIPGDRLWVRETWGESGLNRYEYRAFPADGSDFRCVSRWRPSIHMPRVVSRITLEIVSVRVERLQDISEADAMVEGIKSWGESWDTKKCAEMMLRGGSGEFGDFVEQGVARSLYRALWESINGPGSWDANPWVWVIEFKKVEAGS
jgi:hypothetical protein